MGQCLLSFPCLSQLTLLIWQWNNGISRHFAMVVPAPGSISLVGSSLEFSIFLTIVFQKGMWKPPRSTRETIYYLERLCSLSYIAVIGLDSSKGSGILVECLYYLTTVPNPLQLIPPSLISNQMLQSQATGEVASVCIGMIWWNM